MNILVLQHIKIEDPGYIKDLMLADGVKLTTIELDEGEKIPSDLSKFDAMFCMGGPMDTYMEKEYPWLIEEKRRIKEFVEDLKKPYLGFCLGSQILGEILGGKIVKSLPPEIGILDVFMTEKIKEDKVFFNFPRNIKALQWHSYEVSELENNKDVTVLGSSLITKYQIFKYQNHAYGVQFHTEIKEGSVNELACIPELKISLKKNLGLGALKKFNDDASKYMSSMNDNARNLYNNFKNLMT